MRLLVVGMALPNPRIDNHTIFTAPSLFDYDAILVDPEAVSQAIEGVVSGGEPQATAADEPVVNAATTGLNVGIGDLLRRRRDETERLLQRGGTVAVFARPNLAHPHVAGFAGADRYSWLPAPLGLSYGEPYLVPAFGTEVALTDSASLFAPFIDGYRQWFHYRAYFAERYPSFAAHAHVFARSTGGAAVGVEIRYGQGRIVFLPAMFQVPTGDLRFNLARTLLDCLSRSVQLAAIEQPPDWAKDIDLPGTAALEQGLEQASQRLQEAADQHAEAETKLDQVARYRRLLWEEGRYGLESAVRDAFQLLGFSVSLNLDQPAVLEADGRTAFLEVEGSPETVAEWPYFRLQKRLEKDLLETREPKKGVLVVNGQRQLPLSDRDRPYTEALRVAAENYRYALLTGERLLDLVRAALARPDEESLRAIRDLVFVMAGDEAPSGFPKSGNDQAVANEGV